MNYPNVTIQQGWECPKCKRVYSPTTSMCLYCPNTETFISSTTTNTTLCHEFISGTGHNICAKCGLGKERHPIISFT